MIAKRIPRRAGTSSPARLIRYMVAAQGDIDPNSWKRTADYILDTKGSTTQGEKVDSFRVTNCGTEDPGDAAMLIEATQARNTRSKADKTYHLVFSFPPGERPSLEVMHAIENELCEAIGYADHQRISAVHTDTDHLHVHVAINKVHPTGLQNIEPFYDKQRLMEACERLEIKHGLQRTNHGLTEGKAYERTDRIQLKPEREHDTRFRAFLRQSYHLKITERPEAETYNSLRNLSGSDVAHGPRRYSELLPGDARHRLEQGRAEQPDSVRRSGNGLSGDGARVNGKAGDMEAHAGIESLTGYAARELAPAMRKAESWQGLHSVLAEHGLQIKRRGAGLVIGDDGLKLWCKASDAGRDLSMKALTERLGPFEKSELAPESTKRKYQPKPRQTNPVSAKLFAEYQRQRQAALVARNTGFAEIKAERQKENERIARWAKQQRVINRGIAKGLNRKVLSSTVKSQAAAARREVSENLNAKRKALMAKTSLPNWQEWLMQQAEAGDLSALDLLRSRAAREEKMRGDLLTAELAEQAKSFILKSLKPKARKDGTMSYHTADGGLVLDRKTHVQAQQATAGAAFVALSIAAERFENQNLVVNGTAKFREDVARLAGMHAINVTFADPELEVLRKASAEEKRVANEAQNGKTARHNEGQSAPKDKKAGTENTQETAANKPQSADSNHSVIQNWIDKRNADRAKISSIEYNRLWTPKDAGKATYQGRRRMVDGSEVLLLKRGDEMLVKPSGPRVVAKASKWKIGKEVSLDSRGRFINNTKGIEL